MNKPAATFVDSNGDTHPIDAIRGATVHVIAPQEPQAGGSYRRNDDGSITCLQRTEPGPHDGRRRAEPPPQTAPHTNVADHQE